MPAHLRPCFVYCSMFPKDYVFRKDDIVRLWMAQGYITPQGKRRPEDIGNEYFNDLRRRAFFDSHPVCGIYDVMMHDMVHDLAQSIAGNVCYTMVDEKLLSFPDEARHLFVEARENLLKRLSSYNLRALRTLVVTTQNVHVEVPQFPQFPPMTRCLRALQLNYARVDELQNSISNLKHLCYLHVNFRSIERFPESVCLLYHLQTLVISCDAALPELPDGLGNLINLRYLELRGSDDRLPCLPAWIGKLTNLQSLLGEFEVRRGKGQRGMGVLKDVVNLQGSLLMSGLRNLVNIEDAKNANLKSKHRLEELSLIWDELRYGGEEDLQLVVGAEENMDIPADEKLEEARLEYLQPHTNLKMLSIEGYGGSKFPKWVGNPFTLTSLQSIIISNCKNIRSLPLYIHKSLEKERLSSLEMVQIFDCEQLTSIEGLHDLCSLKILDISQCPQLRLVSKEGLPLKLETLYISECQQLTSLFGLQNLHLLKGLNIKYCPQLLFVLGLPSKLEALYIVGCQQLASLSALQNLHLLKRLGLSCLTQVQLVFEEGLPLEGLCVEDCPQMEILSGLQNLHLLKRLDILRCPQLELVSGGLPLKLEYLHIEECQQLSLLLGLQNLHLLKTLHISYCHQLQFVSELPSRLDYLNIEGCHQLTSLPVLQNLHLLQALRISCCHQLQFVSELPSRLEDLDIEGCQQLTSLSGLQNLTSLKKLCIYTCPKLQMMPEDKLSYLPLVVLIFGCPGLGDWCQIQNINCFEVKLGRKLILSNNWVDIKHEFDQTQQCR